jgi:hypothetical protein
VEAGTNVSTVALPVVGDQKGTQCLVHNWTIQFGGSLESESVKYGHVSRGTRT